MDYYIQSRHEWNYKGTRDLHMAAAVVAYFKAELGTKITKEQAILFSHTLEFGMLCEAAEEAISAKAAPPKPREDPPPVGATWLSNWELIATEEYRKYKTYISLKNYSDIKKKRSKP